MRSSLRTVPLIGAFLLSATPAIADEFLYMACMYEVNIRETRRPSEEITDERDIKDIIFYKINLTNKTLRSKRSSSWDDIDVRDNQIILEIETDDDDDYFQGRNVIPLNPPGPTSSDWQSRTTTALRIGKAKGMCSEIEPSMFENGFKQ